MNTEQNLSAAVLFSPRFSLAVPDSADTAVRGREPGCIDSLAHKILRHRLRTLEPQVLDVCLAFGTVRISSDGCSQLRIAVHLNSDVVKNSLRDVIDFELDFRKTRNVNLLADVHG